MKIKTAEATKLQLDWGLALARGYTQLTLQVAGKVYGTAPDGGREQVSYTDPAVCMGLIEQYSLAFSECDTRHLYDKPDTLWRVVCRDGSGYGESEVLAQAVARCVIAVRLGDEFEVPDELGVVF